MSKTASTNGLIWRVIKSSEDFKEWWNTIGGWPGLEPSAPERFPCLMNIRHDATGKAVIVQYLYREDVEALRTAFDE